MGHTARLRIIHDRFVARHDSCALRRHLDSVPPETPIRDIVDRCRVWRAMPTLRLGYLANRAREGSTDLHRRRAGVRFI